MNTRASVGFGWAAYTVAFCVGGAIGWHRYYYAPGGRRDRDIVAEKERFERERVEADYEQRVRQERAMASSKSDYEAKSRLQSTPS
jgi:hypothetical protein